MATPGRNVREYDENLRELKKENFNLKLRIYFLEERIAAGGGTGAHTGKKSGAVGKKEDLAQTNMELKAWIDLDEFLWSFQIMYPIEI